MKRQPPAAAGSATLLELSRPQPKISAQDAMSQFCQGCRLEQEGRFGTARVLFLRAAQNESVAADALQACARVERELGMLHESIATLTSALHHCVDDPLLTFELYAALGDVHAQLEDMAEATYYYRRAQSINPDSESIGRRLRSAARLASSTSREMPTVRFRDEESLELDDWDLATGW